MFSKEELETIFSVFENLETEDEKELFLKKKMSLLDEQRKIGDEANQKISELQDKIEALYKDDKNEEK